MPNLRPIPSLVFIIFFAASLLAAGGIGGALWVEAAEADRVAQGGEANMQAGIGFAFFGGIVPVFSWLAASISSGILLGKRARARQDAGRIVPGWGPRAGSTLGMLFLLLVGATVLVWLLWFLIDLMLAASYGEIVNVSDMNRSVWTVAGLVFGPGITGGVPASLLTVSSGGEAEEDAIQDQQPPGPPRPPQR